jgi:Leucine-rich repeat (LRR) protein
MKSMAKLVSLHVHHNEIYVWPWCLEYLTSLTELHLNHNAIEEVPAVCSSLHALRELQLSGNKIWTLPVEVNGWSSLTELKMDQNRLPQLPETLGQLERLEFVSFAENHIDAFPTEVGKWVHMKSLDLSGNQIPYLPEAICNSTALKKLLLEGNPLVQLPLAMGCMRALKKLSYTGKGVWISPPNEVMGKTYNNVIKYLQKYDDAKTTNQLDLSKEKHEYLHADILSLSNLTELDLSDNLLENLTVVIGEVDGSWTKLKGDRDLYVPEAVYQDKQNAKMAMLSFLGEGLNNRQLAQRCEKIFSQIDYDQGGTLGLEELDICFRRMGCKVSREVILMMVMEVSEDGDQEVNMNEWNKMVQSIYKGKKDCQGIGDLKNLVTLNLSRNKLTRLPYGLGFCTALQHLVIDEPHMIVIPCDDILRTCGADATILTRYLRQIHQACISNKLELNGFIINVMPTEIFELTALTELHMSGNSVKIVGAEIEALQQLKLLDLSYNRIKLLPPTLGKLRKLEEFDVQSNALQHLPAVICTMDKLSKVHVIGNKPLSVPREVQNAGTPTLKLFMKGIYTGSNDGVVNWSELNKLKVAKLKEVPNVLFSMNWISDLNLDDNAIKTLPAEMGTLKALTRLSARHNFIEKLPSEMKRCKNLEKLYIDHNRLTKLPTFVYTHLPINVLGATHNKLDSSCIPESLPVGSASRLQALTLDHNSLGKLSGAIEVFGQLKMLSLNFNALGGMPPELGSVTALTDLQFDGNEVEELPVSMQNLTNLVRLKFNDNKVVYIPDWIGKFTKLQQLSAGNNRLQFIPYPITALKLSILTLDGNPLTAVETGVLVAGPKEVVHFLDYNHNYDLPDRNLIPDPIEQRRQINAHINSYAHEAHRLHASRLESEYRNIGGFNSVEIAYNKQIGHDRTEGSGAIILDEEMLRDVQVSTISLSLSLFPTCVHVKM